MLFVIREGDLDAKDVYQGCLRCFSEAKSIYCIKPPTVYRGRKGSSAGKNRKKTCFEFTKKSECPISDDDLTDRYMFS